MSMNTGDIWKTRSDDVTEGREVGRFETISRWVIPWWRSVQLAAIGHKTRNEREYSHIASSYLNNWAAPIFPEKDVSKSDPEFKPILPNSFCPSYKSRRVLIVLWWRPILCRWKRAWEAAASSRPSPGIPSLPSAIERSTHSYALPIYQIYSYHSFPSHLKGVDSLQNSLWAGLGLALLLLMPMICLASSLRRLYRNTHPYSSSN